MRVLKWMFWSIGLFSICLFSWALGATGTPHHVPLVESAPSNAAPADVPPGIASAQTASAQTEGFRILIYKAARKLEVFLDGQRIHEFKVVLGPEPEGTKLRQGDGKTPEGVYFVRVKNSRSQFYLSLGLSYPERRDAERALAEKQISKTQYNKIVSAHDAKKKPPSNTPLGGEIFIHGGGTWAGYDWTAGCVALDNSDMKMLFEKIPSGTEVEILP